MMMCVMGDTDTRPVVYTILRLMSTYSETSLVTNDKRHLALSDTKKSGGYYLDSQINYLEDLDDYDIYIESMFYTNFLYSGSLPMFCDVLFYCSQQGITKQELLRIQKMKATHILPIELYSDKTNFFDATLPEKLKAFEKNRDYTPISDSLCDFLAVNLSKYTHIPQNYIYKTLTGHPYKTNKLPFNLNLKRRRS